MQGNDSAQTKPASVKKSALTGVLSAIAVWLPVALFDLIDEYAAHWSPAFSVLAALAVPFVLTAFYVRHCNEKKPRRRNRAVWLLCYIAVFSIMQCAVSNELLYFDVGVFVPQHPYQPANGIEYDWFFLPAVIVFLIFLAGYHCIRRRQQNDAPES